MPKQLQKLSTWADSKLKYGVAAILLGVPLYPKFPFLNVPGTQVSIRLEDFLIFAVSLLWLLAILPKLKAFFKNNINQAIFLFLAVGMLSTISAIFLTATVAPHIGLLHWFRRVEYLMAFFIGVSSVKSNEDLAFYIKNILLVVIIAFVFGVGQKHFNWPIITTQNAEYAKGIALRYRPGAHIVSTFAGHYDLASYLIVIMPLMFSLLFSTKNVLKDLVGRRRVLLVRVLLFITILMGGWLLVNAASRISIASFLLSVSFGLFLIRRTRYIPIVVVGGILFIGFSSNLIDRYMRIVEVSLKNLMSSAVSVVYAQGESAPVFEDRSVSIRFNVEWPRALRALKKNPILGTGYSSITLATDNDYLRMLGEVGILGFFAFFLIMFRIGLKLFSIFPRPRSLGLAEIYVLSIMAATIGILLNMVFIDILEASKFAILYWLMIGFAVKVAIISKNEQKNKEVN